LIVMYLIFYIVYIIGLYKNQTNLGILATVGFFGYTKYQAVELEKDKLQAQQKQNDDSNSQSINESANNESQSNSQQQSTTEEYTSDEQQVTRNNVFDYAIAAVNEVGDADLLKFQEPVYNNGEWKIDANNKSGDGRSEEHTSELQSRFDLVCRL